MSMLYARTQIPLFGILQDIIWCDDVSTEMSVTCWLLDNNTTLPSNRLINNNLPPSPHPDVVCRRLCTQLLLSVVVVGMMADKPRQEAGYIPGTVRRVGPGGRARIAPGPRHTVVAAGADRALMPGDNSWLTG